MDHTASGTATPTSDHIETFFQRELAALNPKPAATGDKASTRDEYKRHSPPNSTGPLKRDQKPGSACLSPFEATDHRCLNHMIRVSHSPLRPSPCTSSLILPNSQPDFFQRSFRISRPANSRQCRSRLLLSRGGRFRRCRPPLRLRPHRTVPRTGPSTPPPPPCQPPPPLVREVRRSLC